MAKIIRPRNVKTVRNIGPKTWSQMSGHGSGFLVLDLKFWIWSPGSSVWILSFKSCILGPGSWVPGPGSWVPVHSVVIIECDKNYYIVWQVLQSMSENYYKVWQLLQIVTGITKCERKPLWQILQSVTRSDYKVRQALQSVTIITKWDITPLIWSDNISNLFLLEFYN